MSRTREPEDTVPELVPAIQVARAIEKAKQELRCEFVANIDRQALERAIADATKARDETIGAIATSLRRYLKLILAVGLLFLAAAAQFAYAHENRERAEETRMRIDRMERLADKVRGTTEWRNWPGVKE